MIYQYFDDTHNIVILTLTSPWLKTSGFYALLINYLNTRGMILIELEEYSDAVTTLTQATESENEYIAPYPDAAAPEKNLKTARCLYDENKAPVGLIIIAAVVITAIGAGVIYLHKMK